MKKPLTQGCFGNGLTVWFQGTNTIVAHISDSGQVSWHLRNPGRALILEVETIAEQHRTGVKNEALKPLLQVAKSLLEGTFWFFKGESSITPKNSTSEAIVTLAEQLHQRGYLQANFLGELSIIQALKHLTAYEELDISSFIQSK